MSIGGKSKVAVYKYTVTASAVYTELAEVLDPANPECFVHAMAIGDGPKAIESLKNLSMPVASYTTRPSQIYRKGVKIPYRDYASSTTY